VAEILFWAADDINFRSDISATYDRKITALRCHKSQMKAFTSSDPFEWLKNRCREMAQGESYELAEGFHRVELPQ
jgi:LmbE family N-acetylglucosaminyl deacetylase